MTYLAALVKMRLIKRLQNRYYVVTDFFEGRALCRYLTRSQEIDQAVEIVLLISSGLEQCHGEGIIHKCINPYTILIAQRGDEIGLRNEQDVKVDACGYCLLIDLTAITEKKEIQNIFGYMSPEVSGILRASIDREETPWIASLSHDLKTAFPKQLDKMWPVYLV